MPRQIYAHISHPHTHTHTRSVSQPKQGIQPGYKTQQEELRLPHEHSCYRKKREKKGREREVKDLKTVMISLTV